MGGLGRTCLVHCHHSKLSLLRIQEAPEICEGVINCGHVKLRPPWVERGSGFYDVVVDRGAPVLKGGSP